MKRYVSRMPLMAGICAMLAAIGIVLPVAAQMQALTMYDAVQRTIDNYPLLHQRMAEVSAGRAHVNTIKNNRLPSLTLHDQLDMGTANAIQGSYFPLGIVPSLSGSNSAVQNSPNAGNVAISYLQWDFFNFGYYNAQQKEAGAQLATIEANLNGDKYRITENVVSLYLDWLKKYKLLQAEARNVARASVTLTAIRATVLSGLKPGVDSSTASAAYSDARIAYLQAQNAVDNDRITIASYTGVAGSGLQPDTSFLTGVLLQDPLLGQSADSVPLSHPLLDIYQRQYEQQLAANNTVSKKYLPRLGLDGAAWVRNSGISNAGAYPQGLSDGMPYSKYNYLMGVTLTYNIADLKHRHDQLAEGRYSAQARSMALKEQQLNLNTVMQQANASYVTAIDMLKEIPVQLRSAQQAYDQQLALYRSGLNTLIDVTNAQYALLQAETNYVVTQDELLHLLYIRAALSGRSDIFLQQFKR